MKTTIFHKAGIAAFFFLFTFLLFSCQKETSLDNTGDQMTEQEAFTLSEESTVSEASFDDADDLAMIAADEEGNEAGYGVQGRSDGTASRTYLPFFHELRGRIGDCATITVTPNDSTYPKTVTIDFGDSCVGRDGKVRSGKLVLHFTGPIRRPGSVVTLRFVNYYVNRVHVEGTKIFVNRSEPPVHKWSIAVNDGKVTFPNGRWYTYEGVKTVKQIEGMQTRMVRDDVYEITGRSVTRFRSGASIMVSTEDPLIKKVSCHWISEGTLRIKVNDRIFKLDYGFPQNGNCDNKALLLWNNGNSQRIIILP